MRVAHTPAQVERQPRAVAVGSFDGVHRGHAAVLEAARATGLAVTAITFDPHPRIALGNRVELLTTLARKLELLEAAGVETTLVASFTPEFQQLVPEEFAERYLRGIGAETVVAGADFRFGVRRSGDLGLLERLGFTVVVPDEVEGVSSTAIRAALAEGDVVGAAGMLGRRSSSTGPSSPGTSAAGRSGSRPRTCCSSPITRARSTGSTQDTRSAAAQRSRSGRTRTTAAPNDASSRTSSTSTATCTGSDSSSSSGSGSATRRSSSPRRRSSSRSRRDVEATRRARRPE